MAEAAGTGSAAAVEVDGLVVTAAAEDMAAEATEAAAAGTVAVVVGTVAVVVGTAAAVVEVMVVSSVGKKGIWLGTATRAAAAELVVVVEGMAVVEEAVEAAVVEAVEAAAVVSAAGRKGISLVNAPTLLVERMGEKEKGANVDLPDLLTFSV